MIINRQYKSNNFRNRQEEKIQFLILHYTAVPLATTLGIFTNDAALAATDAEYFTGTTTDPADLCKAKVSAHYVSSESGEIFQLVDEEYAAFHAGVSSWNGITNLNNHSIGVEIVNIGYNWLSKFPMERAAKVEGSDQTWCEFTEPQILATIELCKNIIKQHDIKPYNILGHSDIACGRKSDPGPIFPWQRLADAGIGLWYDVAEWDFTDEHLPEDLVLEMQHKLLEFGYDCPITGEQDEKTTQAMKSFQIHFRQNNIDGNIDMECLQIIDSLCKRKLQYTMQADIVKNPEGMLRQFKNTCSQYSMPLAVAATTIAMVSVANLINNRMKM
jgi:N-acetyl-anhydromuramyl-L-alanine amidase AmpD